ncbi:carbonic anhydrase 2-like [Rhipicephalus microplus]|uniref:carbonic anhydrase 2-like n=1 Tax=Rhipicephalus microplus TaxID=6941 RepID=UPI003F6C72AE
MITPPTIGLPAQHHHHCATSAQSLRKCDVSDWVYSVPSNCSISSSIHKSWLLFHCTRVLGANRTLSAKVYFQLFARGLSDSSTHWLAAQETWSTKYPDCKGKSQSPLHLRFLQSTYKDMPPINFFNYDTEMILNVEIRGANLLVSPNNSRVAVYGGPLLVEYTFVLGVLHFGTGSGQGAEHNIDDRVNAAEVHDFFLKSG